MPTRDLLASNRLSAVFLQGLILVALAIVVVTLLLSTRWSQESALALTALVGLGASALAGGLMLKGDWQAALTPLPWCLVACGVYFAFGPLVYFVASSEVLRGQDAVFPVGMSDLAQLSAVNAVGVACLWFGFRLAGGIRQQRAPSVDQAPQELLRLGISFTTIGIVARALTWLNVYAVTTAIAHGVLLWLGTFTQAGIVLLFWWALRGRRTRLLWVLPLIAGDLLYSILQFSKLETLLCLLAPTVAYLLYRRRMPRLVYVLPAAAAVYVSLVPLIPAARRMAAVDPSVTSRGLILATLLRDDPGRWAAAEPMGWWTRLNYAPTQAYVLNEYDSGRSGESLKLAAISLIPRVVWPEKPVIDSGAALYRDMTRQTGTSFGIGAFAEAYWCAGWVGVLVISFALGVAFRGWASFVSWSIRSGVLALMMPVILLLIRSGLRIDGWIHTEYVGAYGFAALYALATRLALIGQQRGKAVELRPR